MVDNSSVLVSSFPSATVDGGYDGSYTRRMARSYESKWDALRGHVRPGVKVLDFGCGMPENARLLRGLVEDMGACTTVTTHILTWRLRCALTAVSAT